MALTYCTSILDLSASEPNEIESSTRNAIETSTKVTHAYRMQKARLHYTSLLNLEDRYQVEEQRMSSLAWAGSTSVTKLLLLREAEIVTQARLLRTVDQKAISVLHTKAAELKQRNTNMGTILRSTIDKSAREKHLCQIPECLVSLAHNIRAGRASQVQMSFLSDFGKDMCGRNCHLSASTSALFERLGSYSPAAASVLAVNLFGQHRVISPKNAS